MSLILTLNPIVSMVRHFLGTSAVNVLILFRLHRASWVSTELFLTFPSPALKAVTLIPLNAEETAGRFRVWLYVHGSEPILAWDRKVEGGFPELKVLVRLVLILFLEKAGY